MGSTFLSSFLPSLYPSLFSVAYVTVIDGSRLLLLLLLHTRQMDEGNVSLHSGALYTCLGFFVSICGSENIRYLHSPYEASSFFIRRYFYYVKNLTLRGEIRIFPVESIDIFTRSARARKTFPVSFFIFNFFLLFAHPLTRFNIYSIIAMDAVQCAVSIQSNIRKKNITSTRVPGCTTVRVLFSRDNKLNLKIRIIIKKKKRGFLHLRKKKKKIGYKDAHVREGEEEIYRPERDFVDETRRLSELTRLVGRWLDRVVLKGEKKPFFFFFFFFVFCSEKGLVLRQ